MSASEESREYHAKDAVSPAVKATLTTGFAGLLMASIQATLTKTNVGALGAFTHYGATVATFAAMGGTYEFFRTASANLRQTNDSYNEAIGGFFSGAALGMRFRTLPAVLGYGATVSIVMAAFNFTGGTISGLSKSPYVDEYERKEALRANKRRPIQETLSELGEGRGIYGPGYAERRAQRIKEKYGIDVPLQPGNQS